MQTSNLKPWKRITNLVLNTNNKVNIGVIGKYVELKDAYKSLDEALTHGGRWRSPGPAPRAVPVPAGVPPAGEGVPGGRDRGGGVREEQSNGEL